MSNRAKLSVVAVVASVTVAVLILAFALGNTELTYSIRRYRGDGEIRDDGFWSFPRYAISFPPVLASQTSSHQYRLEGMPPSRMWLRMRIVGDVSDERLRKMGDHIRVRVRVSVQDDKIVYECVDLLNNWVCCKSVIEWYYWHDGLMEDVDLWGYGKCKLILDIMVDNELADSLVLEPRLSGGGNELP